MTYSSQSDVLSWVRIQDGDEYYLRHKCSLKQQLWEVWIALFISEGIFSSFLSQEIWRGRHICPQLFTAASPCCLLPSSQLPPQSTHKRKKARAGRGNKFTYPWRKSDLNKRNWKADHASMISIFWNIQLSHWDKEKELQKPIPDILRGGVFSVPILCGEVSSMLQGTLGNKIFTGKKNIGLWGILYLLCYWCCYSFPISVPLPAVPFIFLSPSSFSTSYCLFLPLPMFAHLLHLLYKKEKKKDVSVPSVSSCLFRWHFPQVTGKQNSEKWIALGCAPRVKFEMTLPGWRSGSMATTEAPETPCSCESWQTTEHFVF